MGCSSELGGNLGIVWIVRDDGDLEHILKTGPTPPYVAILARDHFTRKNLLEFKENTDRVSGVVFLDSNHEDSKSRSSPFSPDDVCPNRYSGLYVNDTQYDQCKQNSWQRESPISGILYDDIPYPIFLINDKKSTDDIESCFKDHNIIHNEDSTVNKKEQASYPLCGIQLDSFMVAAKNAELCLNSHSVVDELLQSNGRRCHVMDNQNIFAYYKPAYGPLHSINGSNFMSPDVAEKESIVMLVAKLSSQSMFSEISPGADSTITSIVTLLAVADALGRVKNSTEVSKINRNIAFALFDSEPFDYTGSSRVLYNMFKNSFPYGLFEAKKPNVTVNATQNINLTSIDYVIDLDQLANYPNDETIHFHSHPGDMNNDKLTNIFNVMDRIASSENVQLHREDPKLPLPPTSVQQFIKASQTTEDKLLGLVLSNYGRKYNNLFYNSIYDDSHNVYQTSKAKLVAHIGKVAKLIARTLFEVTFNVKKTDFISTDEKLIEQLLECYLIDADCHLFTRAWEAGQKLPSGPISTYKDPTKRSDDMNGAITAHVLSYLIGDRLTDYNLTECYEENVKNLTYNFWYVNGADEPISNASSGICIRSQVIMTSAQSPAYSSSEDGITIDPKYPAWTVSLNGIRNPVRLYLKPSPMMQWTILLIGLMVTFFSILITIHIKQTFNRINKAQSDTQTATLT